MALGIVDAEGAVLLDTLVRPQRLRAWPRAEYIHGISPADVARAPTWPDLAPAIQAAVQDRHVVNLQRPPSTAVFWAPCWTRAPRSTVAWWPGPRR